ncbi:MAG: 7-cyano-7-deazaguanine synthase QueC [Sedimentisphaeraceae bacterium JB056]
MTQVNHKAIVLLSGGLDSSTVAAIAVSEGFECHAVTFSYGQRHSIELEASKRVAESLHFASHKIINLDPETFGGSALTDSSINVPKDRSDKEISDGIPVTYVPVRNLVFLSYAMAIAESNDAFDIFIGVNCCDYSGYPDCRPEFIESFTKTANLAAAASVKGKGKYTIHTPIIEMTKSQIITAGTKLGFDYSITHSCYDPDNKNRPCGKCDSCQLRLKGFAEAGLKDPVEYSE